MTDATPLPEPIVAKTSVSPRRDSRTDAKPDVGADTDADTAEVMAAATVASDSGGRPFWARLDSPFSAGFLLTLGGLAALLLGLALSNLSTIIIYIVFALFAALGIDPIIKWLERHKVARGWGVAGIFVVLAVLVVGLLWLVVPTFITQVTQFFKTLPATVNAFQQSDVFHFLEGIFGDGLETLVNDAETFLTNPANIAAIGGGALQVGAGIATGISGALIVVVLTLYFVLSLSGMKEAMTQFAPARSRPKVRALTTEITDSVGDYLMGMVLLAFFNSVIAFALHAILGLPFPLLMGVIAFVITIIPLVGPVLYWVFASVLALFTNPVAALIFAIVYLIYIQIEAYLITPKVMSKAISIPGSLVVIGALIGGTLLGLLGALVAVPVTASILLILKQVFIPKQDAKV